MLETFLVEDCIVIAASNPEDVFAAVTAVTFGGREATETEYGPKFLTAFPRGLCV